MPREYPKYEDVLESVITGRRKEPHDEFHAEILQEIKDKGLTPRDPEYHRLKMREYYKRRQGVKCICPSCSRVFAFRTLQLSHLKKCSEEANLIFD